MQRINANEVELTDDECAASDYFEQLLDAGYGILDATLAVSVAHPGLDEAYYEYLADGEDYGGGDGRVTLDEV